MEHNLPGSPFASPTKASIAAAEQQTAHTGAINNSGSPHLVFYTNSSAIASFRKLPVEKIEV